MTELSSLPALTQAGLQHSEYSSALLRLAERPSAALLQLHSLLDRPGAAADFHAWPERTGDSLDGDPAVLCLRPREWLCLSESLDAASLHARYAPLIDPSSTSVHDVSDGLALLRAEGAAAPWLLSKLSGLDFLAGQRGGAHCARTRMGDIAVVVRYRGRPQGGFDLIVDRSLARHLWERLTDGAPHAEELARMGWPNGQEEAA